MHILEKLDKCEITQDEWIPTACSMCLHHCGIKIHVVNGVAIKVDPDPDCPDNEGHICAKSQGVLSRHYDPNRITTPLMRTNSEKGLDVDPKWKEITWDEAWDAIINKFKKIMKEDPRKLLYAATDFRRSWIWAWGGAVFGTPNGFFSDVGTTCGGGYHPINGSMLGSFATQPDWYHCNYDLQIGSGDGFESHLHLTGNIKRAADARMRGMKVVSVDPRMANVSIKSDEWIRCTPGTDGIFVLSLMNVIVHELKQYDEGFLKKQTNAPYLIGPDGDYTRDSKTGRATIWDPADSCYKIFNDPSIKDFSLMGNYNVNSASCKPAFQLFADKLLEYTPEKSFEWTSVKPEVVRRIAKEFVEEAKIGQKITIDGEDFPYRPACLHWYRGAHAHNHSYLDNFTYKMMNILIGNIDMVGGHINVPLGWDPHIDAWSSKVLGKPGPSWNFVELDDDGVIKPWWYELRPPVEFKYPPDHLDLLEYLPAAVEPGHLYSEAILDPDRYGINYRPEAALFIYANPVWNIPELNKTVEAIKKLDLVVSMDIMAVSETTSLADIVLPDYTPLEAWGIEHCEAPFIWGHILRRPVLKAPETCMDAGVFLTELSDRLGILEKHNGFLNWRFIAPFEKPQHLLEPQKKYSLEEFLDRWMKAQHGDDNGLDWFIKNKWNMRKKTPKELYWPYGNARLPFYLMSIKEAGDKLRNKFKEAGYPKPWMKDWCDDYLPLPEWKPPGILQSDLEFELIAIYYKQPQITFADLANAGWISDTLRRRPDLVGVQIHSDVAKSKDISTGDPILLESKSAKVEGIAYVTNAIHPKVVAISNVGRSINHPWAIKHATCSSKLLVNGIENTCKVSGCPETAARVNISKLGGA